MPDTWTILKDNSSLAFGDAWEHLENPSTGGSGIVLVDTVEVEFMAQEIDVEVIDNTIDVDYLDTIDVEIVNDAIEVEVD